MATFESKSGASYNFGTFEADTPIEAVFDKPVKEIRVPLALDLLAGSVPEKITGIAAGGSLRFPNIAGYPDTFIFSGEAASDCVVDVIEFGDAANAHYFDPVVPE